MGQIWICHNKPDLKKPVRGLSSKESVPGTAVNEEGHLGHKRTHDDWFLWKKDTTINKSFLLLTTLNKIYLTHSNDPRAESKIEQVLEATPHKAPTIRPPTSHHEKLSKLDEPDIQDTAGDAGTSS